MVLAFHPSPCEAVTGRPVSLGEDLLIQVIQGYIVGCHLKQINKQEDKEKCFPMLNQIRKIILPKVK